MTPLHQQERGLSKAMRWALSAAEPIGGAWYPAGNRTTELGLIRRGLVDQQIGRLTPLGEQVRTHILTEEQQP